MMDDTILENPLFNNDEAKENDADFYENIEKHLASIGVSLPEFYTFDKPKKKHVISWSEDAGYTATGLQGTWKSLAEIYDYIEDKLKHDADFDVSARQSPQADCKDGEQRMGMVFLKALDGERSVRGLIGPIDYRQMAYYSYYSFLMCAKEWLAHPDDVVLAHSFLQHHPVFWSRHSPDTRPNEWDTDNGLSSLWVQPTYNDAGETVFMMEHGAAVPPLRREHYHDPRLDVWESTYEKALIKTAVLTHRFFALDGSERKDVPYTPQAWEVELQERLNEYNSSPAAEVHGKLGE